MKTPLTILFFAFSAAAAQAQQAGLPLTDPVAAQQQAREIAHGDPARWYRDDKTYQARLATTRKEIAAAYREAQNYCKLQSRDERPSCLRAARNTFQTEMAGARDTAMANR
jgi:hypothetical protein